jgi:death on curing protein
MITIEDVLYLHEQSILHFGGAHGIREQGMLESAVDRPDATFGSIELYPTPHLKAAAILESTIKNHPFVDGNKRSGLLACFALLRLSGFKLTLTEDELYDFIIKVASSHLELEEISSFLESNSVSL